MCMRRRNPSRVYLWKSLSYSPNYLAFHSSGGSFQQSPLTQRPDRVPGVCTLAHTTS